MREVHDKIAAGLRDAIASAPIDPAVADAMGWALAMADGAAAHFEANGTEIEQDIHDTYTVDAEEMIRRLRSRGFDIVKLETPHA